MNYGNRPRSPLKTMLGKIFKTVVDVVKLPVAIIKDIGTIGGELTDQEKCYTEQKLDNIEDDLDEIL